MAAGAAAGVVTLLGGRAGAAPVSFASPVVLADDGSNLSNTGTRLTAVNFSTNPVRSGTFSATNPDPNPTINSIPFTGITASGGTNTFFTTNAANTDTARNSGRPSTAAIYPLIYDAAISVDNNTAFNLNLQGLTVGQQYRVQMVLSALDANRTLTMTSGGSTSPTISYGTTNGPAMESATFTADATTQQFVLSGLGTGNRTELSGFTLYAVPEPGSLALAGVGAVSLLGRRRRGRAG